ncbi:MAG: ankyrin repeat domain-containing protein, partial [Bacteroidota bacterium]
MAFIQRLKTYGTERFPTSWAEKIAMLESRLELRKPIRYLTTYRAQSPLTVGWLRPVILFPAKLLEELKENQVMSILAHEMAHVKRHDFLINLIQTILCSLFFYHPGVWWMSARVAEEREHCCDDLAIKVTGKPVGYAGALVRLKEKEMKASALSMAFTGRNSRGFKWRIHRLLGDYFHNDNYTEGFASAFILFLTLGLSVLISSQSPATKISDTGVTAGEELVDVNLPIERTPLLDRDIDVKLQDRAALEVDLAETTAFDSDPEVDMDIDWQGGDDEFGSTAGIQHSLALSQNGFTNQLQGLDENDEFRLLLHAIFSGDMESFRYFLERVDNLNQSGGHEDHYFSPLMAAASDDQVEMVKLLIEKGADVNYINPDGWTALIEAADEGSMRSVKILLAAGADVNLSGPNTRVTAMRMAASENHLDVMRLLQTAGAKLGNGDELVAAAEEGNLEIVSYLLEQGVPVNYTNRYNRTALSFAAEEGNINIVRLLLQNGADVGIKDYHGRTAFSFAAEETQYAIVELLLENGALVDERDHHGRTALSYAAEEGTVNLIKSLHKYGADPNSRDRYGRTPLSYAANESNVAAVQYLIEIGADSTIRDNRGRSPASYAAEEGSVQALEALREGSGPQAKKSIKENIALLIKAAREGELTTVKYLVEEVGMDVNAPGRNGNVALAMAAREGKLPVVEYLL